MSTPKYNMIKALITVIVGLILIIFKDNAIKWLLSVIGLILIIQGLINITQNQKKQKGLIEIVGGIGLALLGWLMISIILMLAGLLLLIYGLYILYKLVSSQTKAIDIKQNMMLYATPIIYILGGGLLCVAQEKATPVLIVIAGILLALNGALNIFKEIKQNDQ